ncbi:DUF4198 domain-containing protein [Fimbriiglobus ruber]|uniref:DUF4198 domain-containing protein n=1 Tax=Fimbriiglobus ruber TaxID=1908690 RepID=A0A225D8C6_9BACT|nr:DUF4198 domain-containing protein [Fimbriiglobus ruber]OWK34798.1 hypothetical protein FRUB_09640 [Fimbriiglobus ruber]
MRRMLVCLLVVLALTVPVQAHFFFIIPGDATRQTVHMVFSDSPTPDKAANADFATAGQFWTLDAAGQKLLVSPRSVGDGWFEFPDSANTARELHGMIEYGVVQRGQPEPALIIHHPKAIIGPVRPQTGTADRNAPAALEITPVVQLAGIAFQATANGQPLRSTELLVMAPDDKRPRAIKTNADGITPTFEKSGQYAVRCYVAETKDGEYQGRTYKQIRRYATLVARFDGAK